MKPLSCHDDEMSEQALPSYARDALTPCGEQAGILLRATAGTGLVGKYSGERGVARPEMSREGGAMIRRLRPALVVATVSGLSVVLAACGSTSAPSSSHASSSPGTVSTSSSSYGTIITSGRGVTYYMFTADSKDHSACTGACAQAWKPVVAAHPTVGGAAQAGLVSTFVRAGGVRQVAYDGHPLYTFISDTGPHVITGEGVHAFGGTWYVLSPSGTPITATSSSTSSSSGGYGGY